MVKSCSLQQYLIDIQLIFNNFVDLFSLHESFFNASLLSLIALIIIIIVFIVIKTFVIVVNSNHQQAKSFVVSVLIQMELMKKMKTQQT